MRLQSSQADVVEYDCLTDLRIRVEEIPLGSDECEIYFVKATIAMVLEGFEPISGSRYGEPKKDNVVERVRRDSESLSVAKEMSAAAGLEASFDSLCVNGSFVAGANSSKSINLTKESTSHDNHYRVKAVANLKWEITEHDGSALCETYLESDRLVALRERSKINRKYISVDISIKQRDLRIENSTKGLAAGVLGRLTGNQKRLFDIFIAKSINSKTPEAGTYSGAIKLSWFTLDSSNGDFDE